MTSHRVTYPYVKYNCSKVISKDKVQTLLQYFGMTDRTKRIFFDLAGIIREILMDIRGVVWL